MNWERVTADDRWQLVGVRDYDVSVRFERIGRHRVDLVWRCLPIWPVVDLPDKSGLNAALRGVLATYADRMPEWCGLYVGDSGGRLECVPRDIRGDVLDLAKAWLKIGLARQGFTWRESR